MEHKHSFQCHSEKSFGMFPSVSQMRSSIGILRTTSTRAVTLTGAETPTIGVAAAQGQLWVIGARKPQVETLPGQPSCCSWLTILCKEFFNSSIPLPENHATEPKPPCLAGPGSLVSSPRRASCRASAPFGGGWGALSTQQTHPGPEPSLSQTNLLPIAFWKSWSSYLS